jgi:hypothetical protein
MRIIFFAFFIITVLLTISCHEANDVSFPNYGFDFPKNVSSHDSNEFYYPLKDILSRRDSILNYEFHYLYNAYNEDNLSIRPAEVPTIRFTYAAMSYPVIIKLTPNTIIIKQGYKGWLAPQYGITKLTPTERLFFYSNQFRYDSSNLQTTRWREWDSLIKVYPMFNVPAYYNYVLNKAELPNTDPLKYHTKRIHISHTTYVDLVNSFNTSDFWTGKVNRDCKPGWTDGGGYILEVNTGKKYNVIFCTLGCPINETIPKFCQDLINLTDLGEEIQLYWKNETIQADTLTHSN